MNKENLEIELSWERCTDDMRYYYWRVKPNQLSWWNRLFNNSWNQFNHAISDHWNPCYYPEQYWEDIDNLKTVGDVIKYEETEWNKIQKVRKELIESKLVFPYEY